MSPVSATPRRILALPLLGAALVLMAILAASMGFIPIPARDVLGAVLDAFRSGGADRGLFADVVLDVRLPRILVSIFVGFGLAMSGTVFQAVLRNPLADPFTLGVSSGAAFGAALALLTGFDFLGGSTVAVAAFLGAALTLGAVLAMTGRGSSLAPPNLVLSGVIVASILSAALSFIKYLADERVSMIVFWLLGSFASKTWGQAWLTGLVAGAGFLLCMGFARDLNVMSLGERTARSLGVETGRVRLIVLLAASLVSAVCVAVSGIIGFVGLIIPHLMRFVVGPDNRLLLPASGLAGAMLLLMADTVTRAVLPHEVPIGVLTALIGGPVFCWLFRRIRLGRGHD